MLGQNSGASSPQENKVKLVITIDYMSVNT
jgi:hypothetical protein